MKGLFNVDEDLETACNTAMINIEVVAENFAALCLLSSFWKVLRI